MQPISEKIPCLKHIVWQLDGDRLLRYSVNPHAIDEILNSEGVLVLQGISDVALETYYWTENFGIQAGDQYEDDFQLPSAVRITLQFENGLEYEKLIDIANGS